ncbi:MAG: S24/S26 family peptidase [Actinobacteria bacterium]|nr:S24/S26 family peptidase [Actinomycetota bacterium]
MTTGTSGLPADSRGLLSGRWQTARVAGPSMVPTLAHGDLLLVRLDAAIRAGDVVLARFPALADRLVVKRAERPTEGGWWLTSDNVATAGDSNTHGPGVVLGRVILRYCARGPWIRRLSRHHLRVPRPEAR